MQAQQLFNCEAIASPLAYFSSASAKITLSEGGTPTRRVGDIGNLKDDHQYRVLEMFAPSGPIVFKRTDGSTHRSFLRTPAQVVINAPPKVNQTTQTDSRLSTSDDPLAQVILQCYGADAVDAYHLGRPYCLGDVH